MPADQTGQAWIDAPHAATLGQAADGVERPSTGQVEVLTEEVDDVVLVVELEPELDDEPSEDLPESDDFSEDDDLPESDDFSAADFEEDESDLLESRESVR